jgi:hypothetical protein
MAQHDYILANQSGAAFRSDLNNGLAAIVSNNSGVAQPSTTYAYQWWSDTTTGLLKLRNAANNAWITIGTLADANLGLLSLAGGTLTGALLADDSGTAALPAIAFDGDPDTGAFRAGANEFGIATNGVERVEFGTSEVVFNDGGANYDFRIEGDTNANLFKIDAGTDQVQVANLNGGPLAGFRNRIINGNFDIAQRGTSFVNPASGTYTSDRWVTFRTGSSATYSRQAFTLGQTSVPGEPTYFFRAAVTTSAGAGNFVHIQQRIESVGTFAGQQITVSFWAKADAAKPISVELEQQFGTGGSPSAAILGLSVTKVTLGTSWQKVTVTATVPSISGKTLGSNNNDVLGINIWFDAGSDFNARTDSLGQQSGTFDIAQVQIEPGSVATPFERRPIGAELALCQRYYETGRVSAFAGVINTHHLGAPCFYKVTKRAVPTVALVNVSNVQFPSTVGGVLAPTTTGFNEVRVANNTGANGEFQSDFTASAEL